MLTVIDRGRGFDLGELPNPRADLPRRTAAATAGRRQRPVTAVALKD